MTSGEPDTRRACAHGAISTGLPLSFGAPPVPPGAGVHMVEVFTTGISAHPHFKPGSVEKMLFLSLPIPDPPGCVSAAPALTRLGAHVIKPFMATNLPALRHSLRFTIGPVTAAELSVPVAEPVASIPARGRSSSWGLLVESKVAHRGARGRQAPSAWPPMSAVAPRSAP